MLNGFGSCSSATARCRGRLRNRNTGRCFKFTFVINVVQMSSGLMPDADYQYTTNLSLRRLRRFSRRRARRHEPARYLELPPHHRRLGIVDVKLDAFENDEGFGLLDII